MNERELHDVMTYIFADSEAPIATEKRRLWLDQFGHLSFQVAMSAARVLMSQKIFGRIPRVSDFADAVEIVTGATLHTWGEAWDLWTEIARRHSRQLSATAFELFKSKCPVGAHALGEMHREWFTVMSDDLPTMRAHFRQRYEALAARHARAQRIPPDVQKKLGLTNLKLITDRKNGTND